MGPPAWNAHGHDHQGKNEIDRKSAEQENICKTSGAPREQKPTVKKWDESETFEYLHRFFLYGSNSKSLQINEAPSSATFPDRAPSNSPGRLARWNNRSSRTEPSTVRGIAASQG